jgi:hypothetical protein
MGAALVATARAAAGQLAGGDALFQPFDLEALLLHDDTPSGGQEKNPKQRPLPDEGAVGELFSEKPSFAGRRRFRIPTLRARMDRRIGCADRILSAGRMRVRDFGRRKPSANHGDPQFQLRDAEPAFLLFAGFHRTLRGSAPKNDQFNCRSARRQPWKDPAAPTALGWSVRGIR